MLTFTIYHSQTNDQSKRTNQTIEIVLRYYLTEYLCEDFVDALLYLQFIINNFISASTDLISNEMIYEFRVNDTLSVLSDLSSEDINRLRQIKRDQVKKIIVWINIIIKHCYDRNHTLIELDFEMYLKLHYDYFIFELSNRKFSHQRVDFLKIKQRVETLTYELKLSSTMRIHLVVFVTQLESTSDFDSYDRSIFNYSLSVQADENSTQNSSKYEIERLLEKKMIRNNIYYLMKWKDYSDIWNT